MASSWRCCFWRCTSFDLRKLLVQEQPHTVESLATGSLMQMQRLLVPPTSSQLASQHSWRPLWRANAEWSVMLNRATTCGRKWFLLAATQVLKWLELHFWKEMQLLIDLLENLAFKDSNSRTAFDILKKANSENNSLSCLQQQTQRLLCQHA